MGESQELQTKGHCAHVTRRSEGSEEAFIGRTLGGVLRQDYPSDRLEIIVADGMSEDDTRQIVRAYAVRSPGIRLIDNKARVAATGLNAAIAVSRGDVICRIDGHCQVAEDFITQNVRLLQEHPEAWVVGGPIVHAGASPLGEAIAIAMAHPLGVGMARHRFPMFEGYVKTVQFPTFRRWVFDRIGMFDPDLVRTEDDELHFRVERAGGRMFISPRVRYVYYVRGRLTQLFRQYFQYSFWRIPVMRKHKRPTTVRQVVPLLYFATMATLLVGANWAKQPLIGLALPAAYAAAVMVSGVTAIPYRGWRVASLVPLAVATMHLAYALGMAYGLAAALFNRRAWDPRGAMSALSR